MKTVLHLLVMSGALLGACSKPPADTMATADARGAELLAPFKSNLMQALSAGMQDGPAGAIEVCSEQAPAIARSLSANGVRMGRSSHKLRNPDNAPPDWLAPLIEAYASGAVDLQPRVVAVDDGRTGYAEPIVVQPLCLACHGAELDAEVAEQLAARYPDDQATGFSAGDFRGVFWVEF